MQKTVLDVEKMANVLKLLGDKTRLSIIGMVSENECCVCEFVEIFKLSQPAISQHLRKLKDTGLVKETKRNQWVFYSINKDSEYYPVIKELLTYIPEQKDKLTILEQQGLRITCI